MRFIICLSFLFSFSSSFSQGDSVENRFTIGVIPLLLFSPTTDILFAGYQIRENWTIEIGGGTDYGLSRVLNDKSSYNFTVRSAIKYSWVCGQFGHREDYHFITFHFFYRHMEYNDRRYYPETDAIFENASIGHYFFNGGSERENDIAKIADETKNVYSAEFLFGRGYLFGRKENFVFEYYYGLGFRFKYRYLSITQAHTNSPWYLSSIDPPKNERIVSFVPTIHCGVKLAYTF